MEKKCTKCFLTLPLNLFCKKDMGRHGVSSICRSCSSQYSKTYYSSRPEKRIEKYLKSKANGLLEKNRKYARENKEKIAETKRRYNAKNKQAIYKKQRKYYDEHKEKILEYGRNYRQKNFLRFREYFNQKHRERYQANKEPSMERSKKRRAIKAGAIGGFTEKEVRRLFKVQGGKCALCKIKLPKGFHRDHIIPLCRGGENTIQNIQLLCKPCNLSKGTKDPIDYMRKKGYLL